MVRVSNGFARHKRHKKFFDQATWFRLWRKNVYKQVRLALIKQGEHAYEWRKEKKRDFRKLRIERISAVVRTQGYSYSAFIHECDRHQMLVNRKVLSNIALAFPGVFDRIVSTVMKK
jgi:large subunit ribosomal protein L20